MACKLSKRIFLLTLPGFLAIFLSLVCAQNLPFKNYSTVNGLGNNRVSRIYQDKKGFLWFATFEGLSRFDGYEFVTYGVRDGLPNPVINDILEDSQGRYWVAANDGGIALLDDQKNPDRVSGRISPKFITFLVDGEKHGANKVDRLLIDSKNNLWCLTDDGIYRAPVSDNPEFTLVKAYDLPVSADASLALFEDRQGNIWFGINNELFEMRGDEIINHGFIDNNAKNFVINALQTADGRFLVLSRENGLYEFLPASSTWQKLHGSNEGIRNFYSLIEDRDGNIWFGGEGGLLKLSAKKITKYGRQQNFTGDKSISLFQDREGNIWSGNYSTGITKLSDMSIFSYPVADGETSLGVMESNGAFKMVFCEDNKESSWVCRSRIKNLTDSDAESSESFNKIFQFPYTMWFVRRGNLWIAHSEIAVFPAVEDTDFYLPDNKKIDLSKFFDKSSQKDDDISVYLDEQNSLWISKTDGSIYRLKSNGSSIETGKFQWEFNGTALMVSDRKGDLWLFKRGTRGGRLRNGGYESLSALETIPTQVSAAFVDSRGWLWAGSYYEGVFVCKNPSDEKPVFVSETTASGLLSDQVLTISEDNDGLMYFGTSRGLSRLDTRNWVWNSFTMKDGLTGDSVFRIFKDSEGNMWINTRAGVTKFDPKIKTKDAAPPPIYITHIKIAGQELPLSETGTTEAPPVSLDASQNNLTIDFVGLNFKSEDSLNYQYKLQGTDKDWSKPGKNRSIYFANLDSGDYRFMVRAVNENETQPAVFQFKISPPIYLRWWFVALGTLLIAAIICAFYRVKLQKMLEIERTRTLIATDLHDDIGSNLSKISILSEVVRMQLAHDEKSDNKLLTSIAEISRESVSSMSDIVWAINPKRDSAREMVRKMIEYAEDLFVPKGISVKFSEPDKISGIKIPMDLRRDIYLIFKESVNNIAKHSSCQSVDIIFEIQHGEIFLRVADDGKGFDLSEQKSGNGLSNMKNRVEKAGGTFSIFSAPGNGTKITIRLPPG